MAAIALKTTAVSISPVNDYEYIGRTLIADVDLVSGAAIVLDATTGRAVLGGLTEMPYGIVLGAAQAGEPVNVIMIGVVAGYNVDALSYGDPIWSGALGVLDTAEGVNAVTVGMVVPISEIGSDKLVEFRL